MQVSIAIVIICLRIVKFKKLINNIIKNEQNSTAYQFRYNYLPLDLNTLFQIILNKYNTRNMVKGGLVVPKINTVSYGERSLRFVIPKQWNDFITNVKRHITDIFGQTLFLLTSSVNCYSHCPSSYERGTIVNLHLFVSSFSIIYSVLVLM